MSLKTLSLSKDLCRCCHAEGSFDDLAQPYSHDDTEEVYSDMIKESLNIEINPVPGQLCVVTYKICKSCILRVRDVFLFKKQVQNCETLFMEMYRLSVSKNKELALSSIKEEFSDSADAREDFSPFNDYDDDYDMKLEDSEDDTIASLKETKSTSKVKSKATVKSKAKKGKEQKTGKIKEEDGTAEERTALKNRKKTDLTSTYDKFLHPKQQDEYTCISCDRVFKKRQLFTQHVRHVHLKLRPKVRACLLCNEMVPAHKRNDHMEQVHGQPPPTCGACGKKFEYPFQVLRHQKTFHMGEKLFSCSDCSLEFASSKYLKRHQLKHSSERPFKCAFCDSAFKWKKNLQIHIMMHLDERRHACKACNMKFVQQSSLSYHVKKHHPEIV